MTQDQTETGSEVPARKARRSRKASTMPRKPREPRPKVPMQLRVLCPPDGTDEVAGEDLGTYIAYVTDVAVAKRYIREFKPEGTRFLVVQVKADLKPRVETKTLFKF